VNKNVKFVNKSLSAKFVVIGFVLLSNLFDVSGQSKKLETRCGWLDNPTPANFRFYDKDGEWTIGEQGGYQVKDFDMPVFKRGQWINGPNGSYGYGCACLRMTVDYETRRVLEIRKTYAKPLSACRKDSALRKWKS